MATPRRLCVRIVRNLIIVPPKRGDEAELVVGVAIVDERAHASQPPYAVMQDIRPRSLQTVVAPITIHAAKIGELLGMAAGAYLIVSLVKRAEGSEQTSLIVSL